MAVHCSYQPTMIFLINFRPEAGKIYHFEVGMYDLIISTDPNTRFWPKKHYRTRENILLLDISTF
jgi:hypothetical protein